MINALRNIYSRIDSYRSAQMDLLAHELFVLWLKLKKQSYPTSLFTEISSKCNLYCENCQRTNNHYPSKNINMPFVLFKQIIDQAPLNMQFLIAQGIGESTLNPELPRMIRYAKNSGKFNQIILDSNLLAVGIDLYSQLFANGLNRLIISVDSFDPDICRRLRKGTNIDKLINNLSSILAIYTNQVHLRITVSKVNLHDLESTIKRLISMKVRRIEVGILIDFYHNRIQIDEKDSRRIMSLIRHYGKQTSIWLDGNHTCKLPFTAIVYNARGNLMPCCKFFNDQVVHFGNVSSGLENTYYSDAFKQVQTTFFQKKPFFCMGCPHYR